MFTDFQTTAAMALVVIYVINLIRVGRAAVSGVKGEAGTFITMVLVWVAGIFVAWLFGNSNIGDGIVVGDETLGTLNAASLVIVGLSVAGFATTAHDVIGAIDSSRSTAKPVLMPPTPDNVPVE